MSKPFTDATALLLVLGVLLSQGCASGSDTRRASDAALAASGGAESTSTADAGVQADIVAGMQDADGLFPTLAPGVPVAVPEVRSRNADSFARATQALRAGSLTEAESLLLQITDDQPELAGPWINLAEVFIAQGREDAARLALDKAIEANPANCAARTELGVMLRREGDFSGAESHYRACLEAAPDYRDAYLNLGILYELYLGRLEDALAAYRRYQLLASEPDRRVAGWVMDLERRLGV